MAQEPQLPTGVIAVDPPPGLAPPESGGVLAGAVPMLGSLGSLALVATMATQSGSSGHRSLLAAGAFLLGTLGFVLVQVDRQRSSRAGQLARLRRGYLRHLADARTAARRAAEQQRHALEWHHPRPESLPFLAAERSRVWERGPSHPRFLEVRYAAATQPLAVELVAPTADDDADPVATDALQRLLAVHRQPRELPVTVDLRSTARLEVCGPRDRARALVRALLCSAAAFHDPGHLAVAVLARPDAVDAWQWLTWLPHAGSPHVRDAVGPARMVRTSHAELSDLLPGATASPGPHLLLVLDGTALPPAQQPAPPGGLTVVELLHDGDRAPRDCTRLRLEGEELHVLRQHEEPVSAVPDLCSTATAAALARRLAPLRPASATARTATDGLAALLGKRTADPAVAWRPRPEGEQLRVPIGRDAAGATVHLDLKEAARGGVGPHGLVVGATGSGKSELLRCLVLGLAAGHSPERLNLVLVDFKGGATFAGLAPLPHVSAVVTNLADDLALVDRMHDALAGELVRRQELLRSVGHLASAHDYEAARAGGAPWPPLPSLLVVVDEFSEMLAARPELIDLFVAIGRLGRSLGVHLLLASQRLEEGRLRGLESHLSYRIALRTFSSAESRAVIGVPDAATLPLEPGAALLRTGPSAPVRFRAAYVSGPAPDPRDPTPEERPGILPFSIAEVPLPASELSTPGAGHQQSLLDLVVGRLAGHGTPARRVWLPPLDLPDPLDRLLGRLTADPALGLVARQWRQRPLLVPIGTVDRPRQQRRDLLALDLAGAGGHVAVVGGPRSGRTTLLATLVTSLALTTTPRESQVFLVDLDGGGLAPLVGLPHVSGCASRSEPDDVRRLVRHVRTLLDRREAWFRDHGIGSVADYRTLVRDDGAGDAYGEVFLVVDGWATLRADHDDLERELQLVAARGLGLGVHLVAAAGRWADLRPAVRDLMGTRLELRLGDPLDSEVDRHAARQVPTGRPGRGLTPDGLHFLAALPRIDGLGDPANAGEGLADLVARVAAAWPHAPAPRLRRLPHPVLLGEIRELADLPADGCLLLGLDEELNPVSLDPASDPHLRVLGGRGSGRSSTLRTLLHELARTRTPEQAQVVVVDSRRSLLGEVPESHLLAHHASAAQAAPALRELAEHLRGRLPGPEVTVRQLRSRSWWTGAEVFLVVDDLDLVADAGCLAALLPLLPQATDVGLHLFVACRVGGGGRPPHHTVLQALQDLAAPTLLLPGAADEAAYGATLPGPAGRARLVTPGQRQLVQVAWAEPTG